MTATETVHPAAQAATPALDGPSLTTYFQVHKAMRVANQQLVTALAEIQAGDQHRAAALHRWFNGYAGELRTHHRAEDDLVFPALAARVPAYAEYSQALADDHHHLDQLIDGIAGALAHLASGSREWAPAYAAAVAQAIDLRDLLIEHLGIEDADVLPMIQRNFGAAEYEVIEKQILKDMSLRQAFFTVPWWMATVEPAEAAQTLAEAPLPLKLIYRATRRRYARLVAVAFGND